MSLPPPPEDSNNPNPIESGTNPNLSSESLDDFWHLILKESTTSSIVLGPSASILLDQQDRHLSQTDPYPSFPESDNLLINPPVILGNTLEKIANPQGCSTSSSSVAAITERNNDMNNELMLELAQLRESGVVRGSKSAMSYETEMETELAREKKEDHNAKERVRRMNLNGCYLTLADLLPHSFSSKVSFTTSSPIL